MICVRGVLNGERPEEILGRVPAPGRYKHTRGEILPALGGKFEDGDLLAARSVLKTIDHLEGKIASASGNWSASSGRRRRGSSSFSRPYRESTSSRPA